MMLSEKFAKLQEVHTLVGSAVIAQKQLAKFNQIKVDNIIAEMARVAGQSAEMLARMAAGETRMGRVESKTAKNLFAAQDIYNHIRHEKTTGILRHDTEANCYEIADPVGTIAAIIPTTNPTSTAIFKILIAIKSRNTIVLAPHPRATNCIHKTTELLLNAAVAVGLPLGSISCLHHPTLEATQTLMKHPGVSLILATGGPGLVKAAYRSGKPAYGVGAGNPPAFIEKSADVSDAVNCIVTSQLFDYGTICSSEQSVIVESSIKDSVIAEFKKNNAYFLDKEEILKVSKIAIRNKIMTAEVVGQPAYMIAKMAGFSIPKETSVLLAPLDGTGVEFPLSYEKLAPILAFYVVKSWEEARDLSVTLLNLGGRGHSVGIHSNDPDIMLKFALKQPVSRIIVNAPTSQGGVGYATNLVPSMTLGCGSFGNNIISDNISAKHLLNIKRVTTLNENFPLWEKNTPVKKDNLLLNLSEDSSLSTEKMFSYEKKFLAEKSALGMIHTPPNYSAKSKKHGWPYDAI